MKTETKEDIDYETLSLGDLLSAYKAAKDRKKAIESGELAEVKAFLEQAEVLITRKMRDNGLRQVQDEGGQATFSLTDEIVPKISDWDKIYPYIAENGYWHLLYRKLTARAYRELIEAGYQVPGTDPEVLTRLRMRSN